MRETALLANRKVPIFSFLFILKPWVCTAGGQIKCVKVTKKKQHKMFLLAVLSNIFKFNCSKALKSLARLLNLRFELLADGPNNIIPVLAPGAYSRFFY
jgi:hypothetical protein